MSEWHTGWTEGYISARSEAQAEILRLRAENEKLREECAKIYVQLTDDKDDKIKQIVDAIKSVKSDNK